MKQFDFEIAKMMSMQIEKIIFPGKRRPKDKSIMGPGETKQKAKERTQ